MTLVICSGMTVKRNVSKVKVGSECREDYSTGCEDGDIDTDW